MELIFAEERTDIDPHFRVPTSISVTPVDPYQLHGLIMSYDTLALFLFLSVIRTYLESRSSGPKLTLMRQGIVMELDVR